MTSDSKKLDTLGSSSEFESQPFDYNPVSPVLTYYADVVFVQGVKIAPMQIDFDGEE